VAVKGNSLAINRPVRITFHDLAVTMAGFWTTAGVTNDSEWLTHDIGIPGCGSHLSIVTGGITQANWCRHF